jgi:hypothetical protein
LKGTLRFLFLYEVAEAIRLDALRSALKTPIVEPAATVGPPIPQYLRFERPPVVERIDAVRLSGGERLDVRAKYYDYGVLSIELELPFECDWNSLVSQATAWIGSTELENRATELLRAALRTSARALTRPYEHWLREDYFIVQISEIAVPSGPPVPAKELLASHAQEIAQLVRAESVTLSDAECQEVLQSSISYSQTDLLVVGWSGALVYGSGEVSSTTAQLLEYANTQLLELRYYDSFLTRLLEDVYHSLEHKTGVTASWRLSRQAERVNTIRLDVMELTEKVDNAIKFLSDMFYARLYGLAAAKVGVPDYRRLVDQKLRTAGELYRFMVEQFNQTRSFILELTVVLILVLELVFLFRGK